jgi:type II restriction/modification system DNA methylase subunit YeeA
MKESLSYPKPLDTIRQQDAIVNADGTEPEWPEADVIVGNPPFLGDKKMLGAMGEEYVKRLRKLYQGRVPGGADLVTYWFEKSRAQIEAGKVRYAGLVATNSIRGGANRKVLERICDTGAIFNAWSDEPWINDGAAVRVSLVAFAGCDHGRVIFLNGSTKDHVFANLTAATSCVTSAADAKALSANQGTAFNGISKKGAFDVDGSLARMWLTSSGNPNGRSNADVLFPWINGLDVTRRPSDKWIIHFGESSEIEASCYASPFQHIVTNVLPARSASQAEAERRNWWLLARRSPAMFSSIKALPRFMVTPEVSKHRVFTWTSHPVVPDKNLIVVARADDTNFGILHSRLHEIWALQMGTSLEDRPRYTSSTTFRTFPFPEGLTPADTMDATETLDSGAVIPIVAPAYRPQAHAIADAAHRLNALRENWLNPPEWIEHVPEVVPGYPERIVPKPEHAAELKKRTLTNLYNARPAWLEHAHQALDAAVATSYGWDDYSPAMPEAEILRRLLALNLKRSAK